MAEANSGIPLTLTLDQTTNLYKHSDYFKGMCRFLNIHSPDNLDSLPDNELQITIPLRKHNTTSYFTPEQMATAITFLANCDYRLVEIPHTIPPLALYHIGLYLQSDLLIHLSLNFITPKGAPTMLQSLLDIYPNLQSHTHPHIKLILQLISYYTNISQNELLRLVNIPLGRALRDTVRGAIRGNNAISRELCSVCGHQYPNIKLFCCRFPVHYHCFHERMTVCGQYRCMSCNHKYEAFYADLMHPADYYPVRYTPAHDIPPNPDFPNPNTEIFDLLLQHFPLIRYTVEQNRKATQEHIQKALQARHPPAMDDGRPG